MEDYGKKIILKNNIIKETFSLSIKYKAIKNVICWLKILYVIWNQSMDATCGCNNSIF